MRRTEDSTKKRRNNRGKEKEEEKMLLRMLNTWKSVEKEKDQGKNNMKEDKRRETTWQKT